MVENADTATFDCSFGRGCEGIQAVETGRPSVGPAEQKAIASVLPRVLPLLRSGASANRHYLRDGFTKLPESKIGQPMVRVAGGWCVFFNAGCVLHTVGAEDGDSYQYKPTQCALSSRSKRPKVVRGNVRQWGTDGEQWDLFCLNPANSTRSAVRAARAGKWALAVKLTEVPSSKVPAPKFQA